MVCYSFEIAHDGCFDNNDRRNRNNDDQEDNGELVSKKMTKPEMVESET